MRALKIGYQISQNSDFKELKNLLSKYTKRAYLVGGSVRDLLLGSSSKDYDIEIYDISPDKFDSLMQSCGASGVGKSYFVYKLGNFDLSLPRKESKSGFGHKGFSVEYCNDEKMASSRRDFTINSIMVNIFSGEILDFWGGVGDLMTKRLKITNPANFSDDSLRVLRGVQFVSRFNLICEPKSMEIMRDIDISDLSLNRVYMELEKFFMAKFQMRGIHLLRDLGLDIRLFGVKFDDGFLKFISNKISINQASFLYHLINYYNINGKELLAKLALPNSYSIAYKQPFYHKISKFNMMKIALDMPLSNWLGLDSKARIKMAKKLGFYDIKFAPQIDISSINLSGKAYGDELKRRKIAAIKEHLSDRN
ncbi:CCA tRNA nucleotidyltransferase [Campylobacter porcelli]|uniref:Multifunctional tRNA nucleotidyl transferase / 2'3'-cyclic phosphodiesterase / 2' nucleotidase/phosphatase n=1 Tax=Campylobacter porcelli TaxID=1660073 RepID=A0A1X9SYH0_9BACT|nr:CCA tRNA nucleotidyltransferase [Campylobacter sp. RM6137]ARR01261.1 multifunctional tRNA nucleotidyl transferase / 2'3'-cyclic phosphodiesterase / 2' nucleotidase/phosphatase [Campylobacter sp. RM6137]